jgi:hypothetical protein
MAPDNIKNGYAVVTSDGNIFGNSSLQNLYIDLPPSKKSALPR